MIASSDYQKMKKSNTSLISAILVVTIGCICTGLWFFPVVSLTINQRSWSSIDPYEYILHVVETSPNGEPWRWSIHVIGGVVDSSVSLEVGSDSIRWLDPDYLTMEQLFYFARQQCTNRGFLGCSISYNDRYHFPQLISIGHNQVENQIEIETFVDCSIPSDEAAQLCSGVSISGWQTPSIYPTLQAQFPWLNQIKDGGLLSGEPCGPPCFLGVIPGVTTEQQLTRILETEGMKASCQPYDNEKEGGIRGIDCLSRVIFDFGYQTNTISGLGFTPNRMELQDVIAKYGNPDHVIIGSAGRDANYDEITFPLIFYDQFHMWVISINKTGREYSIKANTPIDTVVYETEDDYHGFDDQFEPWRGYGSYFCQGCLPR